MVGNEPGVRVRVPAKVNLCLNVGPLSADGYHPLTTVFHAVDLTDEIHVQPADDWSCTVTGPYADKVPTDDSNLALRVAKHLAKELTWVKPVAITINKAIPVAGGMAGGSADAAGVLVAMDQLFTIELGARGRANIGREFGADIPFALEGGTALGSGRGDRLAPVLMTGRYEWVFALHHQGLSTPAVYAEFDRLHQRRPAAMPKTPQEILSALRSGDPEQLGNVMSNDLQEAAVSLMPRLQDTLDTGIGLGALGAIVSGSGPTVAFLCADRTAALDLMVGLTATGVADDVVSATGPHPGARIVTHVKAV